METLELNSEEKKELEEKEKADKEEKVKTSLKYLKKVNKNII
jgi:hypothetical protein